MTSRDSSLQIWVIHTKPGVIVKALGQLSFSQPYRVKSFRTAIKLGERLQREQPDLLILNRQIASIDGFAFCRALKSNAITEHIPILITGVNPGAENIADAVDSGVDSFLCNPLNPSELIARAQLALRRRQAYDGLASDHEAELSRLLTELQSARIMSDNIVSNLTHELRTPLLQIKLSVKELKSQGTANVEQTTKLIDHANAATLRLEGVVQKLFQFSTAMRAQKTEPFLIQDVMRSVKVQIERDLQQHGHPIPIIECYFKPRSLQAVFSERLSITQVLTQLVDNAAKFSDYTNTIQISASRVGNHAYIEVTDKGIGIDPSEYAHIFDPYYQVDGSLTRRYGGSGLGLAIVKLILDRMSIPITVDSALGQGTTFRFALPIADLSSNEQSNPLTDSIASK